LIQDITEEIEERAGVSTTFEELGHGHKNQGGEESQ